MEIEKFNKTIDIWILGLESFTIDQLLKRPDNNSWSLGQVYEHIIEETSWYNEQIEISVKDKDNAPIETTNTARLLIEKGSFEDKKFQGDPLIAEKVKQPYSIDQLKFDLVKLKTQTNEICDRISNISAYGKSEHPGIGYLNCYEWLQYSEMHMRHHMRQME